MTYNSARWRKRQVEALAAQTDPRWRLVVIDNASHETQRPHARDFPYDVDIIQLGTNVGFAEANNIAVATRTTPYFIFLNPDAFPEPDWLATLLEVAKRYPRAAAIGSTQWRADENGVLDGVGDVLHFTGLAYRAGYGKRRVKPPAMGEAFAACGAAILVQREAFEAIDGFDARYFCYFEDVDLCFRLRLAGWRVLQTPDAVVAHVGGGSAGAASAFAEFHGARNRLWTFVKCMPGALMWMFLPLHLATTALVATLAPIRGRGLHGWRGIFAGLAGLTPILATRRELQRVRTASVLDILYALAWSPDVLITRRAVYRPIQD